MMNPGGAPLKHRLKQPAVIWSILRNAGIGLIALMGLGLLAIALAVAVAVGMRIL
jgi:hypothetical protein